MPKYKCSIVIFMVVLVIGIVPLAQGQTRSAGCVLKVQADPDVLELSWETVRGILYSSGVLGDALIQGLHDKDIDEPKGYLECACTDVNPDRNLVVTQIIVRLEPSDPPKAGEILGDLVNGINRALQNVQQGHQERLRQRLAPLEEEYEQLTTTRTRESDSELASGTDQKLQTIISLDDWSQEMCLTDAVDMLRNSVDPPLNIAVMWKDLLDNCDLDPMTAIDIDPLQNIQLGTALRLLIQAVGAGYGLDYAIVDGVVTIATRSTLASLDTDNTAVKLGFPLDELSDRQRQLAQEVLYREQDVAGYYAQQEALERQIAELAQQVAHEVDEDPVINELEKILKIQLDRYDFVKQQLEAKVATPSDLADMQESLAETRIRLAKQRAETANQKGGERLLTLRQHQQETALELSVSEARLRLMKQQLQELQSSHQQAIQFDEQRNNQYLNQRSRDNLSSRIEDLKNQLRDLQPMVVTVIGG